MLEVLGEHDRIRLTRAFQPGPGEPVADLTVAIQEHRVGRLPDQRVLKRVFLLPCEAMLAPPRHDLALGEVREQLVRTPGAHARRHRRTLPAPQEAPPPRIVTTYGFDERHQERLLVPEFITYAWCAAFWYQTPSKVRAQVSKARRSQYARIARLPPLLGEKLDKAGVPFYALRFVAYAETVLEQEERARKVLAGERPPRRMPPPPDEKAAKATKRRRGRPAYPRAQPGEKKPRAEEQGSPTAQPHGDDATEQQANQFDEVMSLIAFHLAGKLESNSDPDNESADDDLDEEAPL
ncbi:hypothetical protein WMF26_39165 [Sorangium sp. So ce185]|uniref:hypothetical protein n=1 Tax=Sorangium sp. So ce185 TaxID=3133287 RepID=UPI003F635E81